MRTLAEAKGFSIISGKTVLGIVDDRLLDIDTIEVMMSASSSRKKQKATFLRPVYCALVCSNSVVQGDAENCSMSVVHPRRARTFCVLGAVPFESANQK